MDKPIVVCGVDFSGTSMVAGMLHAAGIDMGDIESVDDVAASDRPIRYRTFQDRVLDNKLAHLAELQMANLPDITHAWLEALYDEFMDYLKWRETQAKGIRWGVKCNGLVFLAMHEKFADIPVQWVTTIRRLDASMQSCIAKLGPNPRYASLLAIQYLAFQYFFRKDGVLSFSYESFLYQANSTTERLCRFVIESQQYAGEMIKTIDPKTKGILPWHGSPPLR